MFHFIKSLEREVYIAAALTLIIIGLTTEGFGGDGKSAITAMAETPAVSKEGEPEGEDAAGSDRDADDPADTEYGRKVVGYFLTKDRKRARNRFEDGDVGKEDPGDEKSSAGQRDGGSEDAKTAASAEAHSLTQQDYQVLLKIVEAEAGVCDDKGKILVANVILNRVKSDEFPDSVTDVVYQPSQFSPVSNGSINSCKVTSETRECVNRALKGEDYSQGALFFMNRAASRSGAVRWFDGRLTYLFAYQDHEFFK